MTQHRFLYSIFFIVTLMSVNLFAADQFGRYIGVFHNETLGQDQPAKLDFILSKKEGNKLELMSVLTLHFGDFKSKEYVAYHFDQTQFNVLTGELFFDHPGQDVTIQTTKFGSGEFEAQLRSAISGNVGVLKLKLNGKTEIKHPRIEPIWGEYQSTCNGTPTRLQLYTYRSSEDTIRVGDPFGAYKIHGQLAKQSSLCGNTRDWCVYNTYNESSYNFFSGELSLQGDLDTLDCSIKNGALSCDGCDFKRISHETEGVRAEKPEDTKNTEVLSSFLKSESVNGQSLSGEYHGYLYHENLDKFQRISLNIIAAQLPNSSSSGTSLYLSAVVNSYFGDFGGAQKLSYKYPKKEFFLLSKNIVLSNTDDDVNAVLNIESIKDGVIKGSWYSLLYGRVGPFIATLPDNLRGLDDQLSFNSLSEIYESTFADLKLNVLKKSSPFNTENPFLPLYPTGYFYYKAGFAKRMMINGGSYDYFTGRIALVVEDEERIIIGEQNRKGELYFKIPSAGFGTRLGTHKLQRYRVKPRIR